MDNNFRTSDEISVVQGVYNIESKGNNWYELRIDRDIVGHCLLIKDELKTGSGKCHEFVGH